MVFELSLCTFVFVSDRLLHDGKFLTKTENGRLDFLKFPDELLNLTLAIRLGLLLEVSAGHDLVVGTVQLLS